MTTPDTVALDAVPSLSRKFRLQYEEVQQAWVLLYPEGMVKLNPSAAEILQRCDGVRDLHAIVAELESAFDQPDLADDVAAFVTIARDQHWITLA